VNSGLTTGRMWCLAVGSNGTGGTNLYAGSYNGVFLSTNNGSHWTAISSGLPNSSITSLTTSANGSDGTNLFAGTSGGGVFLSTDNGTSWAAVNSGLPASAVLKFAVSHTGTYLFAGTGGGGVFRSTDNGTSWTAMNTGLTNTYVSSFVVTGTNVFAGTYGGVFLSTNNGTSWTAANTGLTNTIVSALALSSNGTGGTILFAGTNNSGVWSRPLSEMITSVNESPADLPRHMSLNQNYPNPFNPITVISYELPVMSSVRLSIFDMLGREIAVLVNETKPAGSYQVQWNAEHATSGVYYSRMATGNFVSTKKLVLLR